MNRTIALVFALVAAPSCAAVTSGQGGFGSSANDLWYVHTTAFQGLALSSSIWYCPPMDHEGAPTCHQAEIIEATPPAPPPPPPAEPVAASAPPPAAAQPVRPAAAMSFTDVVNATLGAVRPQVRACVPGSGDAVTVNVTFAGPTGHVAGVDVTSASTNPAAVACIQRAVAIATLPPFNTPSYAAPYSYAP